MLVTLSAPTWDPTGHVQIYASDTQTTGETRRRVERRTTLDGGAVVVDQGYSDADRTIDLTWVPADKSIDTAVESMVKLYERLVVSINGSVYSAVPERYEPGADESQLRLLVMSKLSG